MGLLVRRRAAMSSARRQDRADLVDRGPVDQDRKVVGQDLADRIRIEFLTGSTKTVTSNSAVTSS
jgi:hypothetical protein